MTEDASRQTDNSSSTGGLEGAAAGSSPQARVCEWPGCTEVLAWAGRGRPPTWCGRLVDGVRHNAVNAHRFRAETARLAGARSSGGAVAADAERPVTRALGELGRVGEAIRTGLEQWKSETSAHEMRLRALIDAATAALGSLDHTALDAETAAVRRAAAAAVNAAEQARDDAATAQARAERAGAVAGEAADEAIADAERARQALADAERARDDALARAEAVSVELRRTSDDLAATKTTLVNAETTAANVTAQVEHLRAQLQQARADRDADRAAHREDLAQLRSEHSHALNELRAAADRLAEVKAEG